MFYLPQTVLAWHRHEVSEKKMFTPIGLFLSWCLKTALHCIRLDKFSLTMILFKQGVDKVVLHQKLLSTLPYGL